MEPRRIFRTSHMKVTREELGMTDTEDKEDTPMSNDIRIVIPACETCNRGENADQYGFYLQDSIKPILVEAGLYAGHPANVFNKMSSADAAKIFDDIAAKLLADPLKYMQMIHEETGDRGGYERLVRDVMDFAATCKIYTTAHISVTE